MQLRKHSFVTHFVVKEACRRLETTNKNLEHGAGKFKYEKL